jgi:peptidoglycan/LPS O-acetylase OafA/YrhL
LAAPLWTLSFEFQVYAMLPLAFLAYQRFGTRRFVLLLGALSLAGLCLRGLFVLVAAPHPVIWVTPFLRPDSVLLGIIIALARPRTGQGVSIATIALVAAAALFLALPPTLSIGANTLLVYPVVTLICGSALWLMLTDRKAARLVSNRVFVYLGRRSFGLYVFHSLGIYWAQRILGSWTSLDEDSFVRYFIVLVLALGIAMILAAFSCRFFERPFLDIKPRKGGLAPVLS